MKSVMIDSYFRNTNVNIRSILLLLFLWATDTPVRIVPHMFRISKKTVMQWYQYFRDICSQQLITIHEGEFRLGGDNHILQIDESLLVKR